MIEQTLFGHCVARSRLGANWFETRDGDDVARSIFDQHYSRYSYADGREPKLFVGPGAKLVMITENCDALFVWRKFISRDGQQGVNCAVFRNESDVLSSNLILEAERLAWARWPRERLFTYVNPRGIKSTNPGSCFKHAGWRVCGVTKVNKLLILEKLSISTTMKIPYLAILASCALLTACANQTPSQQANSLAALNSVAQAATAYASGNDVGAAVSGIQGASYFVRALQSTPNAANPTAADTKALKTFSNTVGAAVTTLTANGAPPNAANEAVASALDAAVVQIAIATTPTQASLPVRNAAFRSLSRTDQRDATILFADERSIAADGPRVILNGSTR